MPKIPTPETDPAADPSVGVLTEAEAARYLRLSVWTLRRMHKEKRGPRKLKLSSARIGYRKAELERWLAERELAS